MSSNPTLATRLRAKLAGEVAAGSLDAYRSAGAAAYGLLVEAEQLRQQLRAEGRDGFSAEPATKAFLVCAWNAFALQTLGDEFVEADYRADPKTVGFVPPVTAEQALAFYDEVEHWLVRAGQAKADPGYRLDLHVPAEIPGWAVAEPCPHEHLMAMLAACRKLVEHAELAVADLKQPVPGEHAPVLARLDAELSAVKSNAEYAEQLHVQLHQNRANRELHERIERSIKDALERAYLLGQLAAMPELIDAAGGTLGLTPELLPLPGEPGFDAWCLTDPETRPQWQRDPQAGQAIQTLWDYDPDPARTLAVEAEIEAALEAGAIDYATDAQGRRLGNFYCCPWSAIYVVRRPVRIAGQRLRAMQQFTFDVSAEEIMEGGPFKRELLLGNFQPTSEIDYCDPSSGD